jgi:hypothetical protein
MLTRHEFVNEARSWSPTPYVRRTAIKHQGADCGSFLGAVLVAGGFLPAEEFAAALKDIESLSDDWFMHKAGGKYVELMGRYVPKIGERMTYGLPGEPPGNIILMQTGNSKQRNHGGIVTAWPRIIHCCYEGVAEVNVLFNGMWSHKSISVYSPWAAKP